MSKENGLVLVHTSVGEEQGGVIEGDDGRGLVESVSVIDKEIDESLTDES